MANDDQKDYERIKTELEKRIRVSVEWDGYYDSKNKAKHHDVAIDTGSGFPFNVVKECARSLAGQGIDEYEGLAVQCQKLDEKVKKWAKDILIRARRLSQPIDQIDEKYFEHMGRKFEASHKEDCVLEAPAHWLPHLSKKN